MQPETAARKKTETVKHTAVNLHRDFILLLSAETAF
jgi:hypothetical protein